MKLSEAPRWRLIQERRMNVYTNLPRAIDRLLAINETEAVSLMMTLRVDYESAVTRLAEVEALLPALEQANPSIAADVRAALESRRGAD